MQKSDGHPCMPEPTTTPEREAVAAYPERPPYVVAGPSKAPSRCALSLLILCTIDDRPHPAIATPIVRSEAHYERRRRRWYPATWTSAATGPHLPWWRS